jgi:hypothetical protein
MCTHKLLYIYINTSREFIHVHQLFFSIDLSYRLGALNTSQVIIFDSYLSHLYELSTNIEMLDIISNKTMVLKICTIVTKILKSTPKLKRSIINSTLFSRLKIRTFLKP